MNPYHTYTDAELIELLRQGDTSAFEMIYRKYVKDLFAFAMRKIRIREDCEEIVHDVFESLWKRREQLMIASLKHYLFSSVRYTVIRYFSHRDVKRRFGDHYRLFEVVYDSLDEAEQRDPRAIHAALLQHIDALPGRCQEAIRLRISENLTNGEIAERMKINKGTVELYISKAFSHFRASYDKIFRTAE